MFAAWLADSLWRDVLLGRGESLWRRRPFRSHLLRRDLDIAHRRLRAHMVRHGAGNRARLALRRGAAALQVAWHWARRGLTMNRPRCDLARHGGVPWQRSRFRRGALSIADGRHAT